LSLSTRLSDQKDVRTALNGISKAAGEYAVGRGMRYSGKLHTKLNEGKDNEAEGDKQE